MAVSGYLLQHSISWSIAILWCVRCSYLIFPPLNAFQLHVYNDKNESKAERLRLKKPNTRLLKTAKLTALHYLCLE